MPGIRTFCRHICLKIAVVPVPCEIRCRSYVQSKISLDKMLGCPALGLRLGKDGLKVTQVDRNVTTLSGSHTAPSRVQPSFRESYARWD